MQGWSETGDERKEGRKFRERHFGGEGAGRDLDMSQTLKMSSSVTVNVLSSFPDN